MTVHAPQPPSEQPSFVPVKPISAQSNCDQVQQLTGLSTPKADVTPDRLALSEAILTAQPGYQRGLSPALRKLVALAIYVTDWRRRFRHHTNYALSTDEVAQGFCDS